MLIDLIMTSLAIKLYERGEHVHMLYNFTALLIRFFESQFIEKGLKKKRKFWKQCGVAVVFIIYSRLLVLLSNPAVMLLIEIVQSWILEIAMQKSN